MKDPPAPAAAEPLVALRPVVGWPRRMAPGRTHVITVDLELAGPAGPWPYEREEFEIGCMLDGRPGITVEAVGAPAVVLHRFGGTYGPARFVAQVDEAPGPEAEGPLLLTLVTAGGVPFRTVPLGVTIGGGNGKDHRGPPLRRRAERDPSRDPSRVPSRDPEPVVLLPAATTEADPVGAPGTGTEAGAESAVAEPAAAQARWLRLLAAIAAGAAAAGLPGMAVTAIARALIRRAAVRSARVVISFAGFDRAWAVWIGDRLERSGWHVAFQRWTAVADAPLDELLRDLLLVEGHIVVVLSERYFALGRRDAEEWNAALRAVVAPHAHRFRLVAVGPGAWPDEALALGPVAELWTGGEAEAEARVAALLGPSPAGEPPARAPRGEGPRFPGAQPSVWGRVPQRNARFTGREGALQRVYDLLQGAEPGAAVITLLGLSGVGKTQIAAEYAHRFASEYDVVWWVAADRRGEVRRWLAELAPHLRLATGPEYGERLRAVADALRRGRPHARWLLVFDGADEPVDVADLLPNGPGHVIITSQNREWAEYNTALHEVHLYDRAESVAFIRRRAPRIGPAEADRLAETLGDMPLVLDQTAGWLNDADMSVDAYIALLRSDTIPGGSEGLRVAADFPMTYFATFTLLLGKLQETVPDSVELLRLCAFFAPGAIPVDLIHGIPEDQLTERNAALVRDPERESAAVAKLTQYSVIRWESGGGEMSGEMTGEGGVERGVEEGGDHIHLHPMVHQTVRLGLTPAQRDRYSRAVRRSLAAANPGAPWEPERWPGFARIVPHLEPSGALTSHDATTHRLLFHCLNYFHSSGEYTAGVRLAERAMDAWRREFGDDDPRVWDLASQYATLLRATGAYAASERLDRRVIARLSALRGPRDLTVQRAAEGLGADLSGLGRYDEAMSVGSDVLASYLEQVGERHSRTLNARHNLAASLRLAGRYGEALDLDRRNLAAREEVHGPRHSRTLASRNAYALDLRLLGRRAVAAALLERTVAEHRSALGRDHPQTLAAEWNAAMCHLSSDTRRTSERGRAALAALAALLERAERVLGHTAPLALSVATCYSFAQRAHGDLDRARDLGERVLADYRAALGDAHPFTIGALANHALVLRAAGEREAAAALAERCLADMRRALGRDHPWTRIIEANATGAADPPLAFEPLVV
ncbi:FxSxx-COOH system tetratricopeptide repeat protein [Streptomyces radicis]|uniref:TIR domain-containing protein n=1 Tax=Streptomyces radicis TaxID=1750517 RepID=A0A3A9W5W2_9ACTN|nr:FxSxx-COOH system tetratricopeptide repeat protein [Streptomyces radicis]RKN08585.1 TIR domain-containing protein [Streptomyces radicis]RKN21743.1 TIR domain-containing protein [Streptomyces radicis]